MEVCLDVLYLHTATADSVARIGDLSPNLRSWQEVLPELAIYRPIGDFGRQCCHNWRFVAKSAILAGSVARIGDLLPNQQF